MRKLDGGVCMSCRLRSFQSRGPGGDPRAASLVSLSTREALPTRPFVRDGRGGMVERGVIGRDASEEERDMTIKACALTALLSMYTVRPAAGADYSMDLDAPAMTSREATFDVVLRGTSDAQPALGVVGFTSMINYDPQVLSLEAHSFMDTDFALPTWRVICTVPSSKMKA